jgi:hypothetical protein
VKKNFGIILIVIFVPLFCGCHLRLAFQQDRDYTAAYDYSAVVDDAIKKSVADTGLTTTAYSFRFYRPYPDRYFGYGYFWDDWPVYDDWFYYPGWPAWPGYRRYFRPIGWRDWNWYGYRYHHYRPHWENRTIFEHRPSSLWPARNPGVIRIDNPARTDGRRHQLAPPRSDRHRSNASPSPRERTARKEGKRR